MDLVPALRRQPRQIPCRSEPTRPTPDQRQFARHLRDHQTDCELLLWQKLRFRQIANPSAAPYAVALCCELCRYETFGVDGVAAVAKEV